MKPVTDLVDVVMPAVARALYGDGAWPFTEATGFTVRDESCRVTVAVIQALRDAGELR